MKSKPVPQLVIVGSIGLDTIETVRDKRADVLGGSASYATAAAAYFAKTGLVGIVGTDFPEHNHKLFNRLKIDVDGLQVVEGRTFRWHGVYEENMDNRRTISTELNVFEHFNPRLPVHYGRAPNLFLGNIAPSLQLSVLDQVHKPRFVMVDTMDLWINIAREDLLRVIRRVHLLTLNESEARLLTDVNNLMEAAEKLLKLGPQYVLIKKGASGNMLFSRKGKKSLVPAYPVLDVVDTTGAGDTFAGGFIGYLSSLKRITDAEIHRAQMFGSVMASFNVEKFSLDEFRTLTKARIHKRAAEFRKMMTVP
jgi:sugar/nucleoside kinase (ribokinase family)